MSPNTLRPAGEDLRRAVRSAIEQPGVELAVVFILRPDLTSLELGAAAGIDGPPLERLADAVRNPAHPITRALADDAPSYDVLPTAPGGPALRSHLPLIAERDGSRSAIGVLAVAHQDSLSAHVRQALEGLAAGLAASASD